MKVFNATQHQRTILTQLRKDIECIFHKGVLNGSNVYFEELQEIEKLGVALVAKDESDVVVKLNELYVNESKQRELSEKSKNLFSSKGQDKLYQEIKKIVETKWHIHI